MRRVRSSDLDPTAFAALLATLASPPRIALLSELVEPRAIPDLRVAPGPSRSTDRPEVAMSRQAVREHILKLESAGLVRRVTDAPGDARERFVLHQPKVFEILEEFRKLCSLKGARETEDRTLPAPMIEGVGGPSGPRLVLVHGLHEGRAFPLAGSGPWPVGRRRGLVVSLDYDPFVSLEHAVVRATDGRSRVSDAGSSKNGTWWNWRKLAEGEERALAHGDVLGIGRSILLFRTD